MTSTDRMSSPPPPFDASRVRGLVFDLDGTLIDSYAAIAESLNFARARFGLPALPGEQVRRLVGRGLENLIAENVGVDRIDEGVRLFREHYARVFRQQTTALPGVPESIAALQRRGFRLAVASNKPARFSRPILDAIGLAGRFVAVHGPDSTGVTKPEPGMIDRCIDALALPRSSVVYVGDMVLDVETAARSGLPVLLVRGGSSDDDALRESGQPVVDSLADLLPLLDDAQPEPSSGRSS